MTASRWLAPCLGLVVLSLVACGDDDDGGGPTDADGGATDASTTGMDGSSGDPDAGSADAGTDAASGPVRVCRAFCNEGDEAGEATPAEELSVDTMLEDVANATCRSVLRCCNEADVQQYFAPIRQDGNPDALFAEFRPRLPPDAEDFDVESCTSVMTEIFEIRPFGDWLEAVEAEQIEFDAEAYATCMEELETAACGEEVSAALNDGTCLAYNAPDGGEMQRKMFVRTADDGEPCEEIRDGFGGLFYGTCDPEVAFCCNPPREDGPEPREGDTGCGTVPQDGAVCRAVAAAGESCEYAIDGDLQLCATGSNCQSSDGTCDDGGELPEVSVGEQCFEGISLVGDCGEDAYCDSFDSGRCIAFRENGEGCSSPEQCRSSVCSLNESE